MKSHAPVVSLAKGVAPRRYGTIGIVGKGFVRLCQVQAFRFLLPGGQSDTLQMCCGLIDAVWDKHHNKHEGCRRYGSHILNGRKLRFYSSLAIHFLLLLAGDALVAKKRCKHRGHRGLVISAGDFSFQYCSVRSLQRTLFPRALMTTSPRFRR
jgi:hypothetical protein